jgi:hypothetical protein
MSAKMGFAPRRATVPAVAKKVNGEVSTSSPGPMPRAISATSRASVPEDTPTAGGRPTNAPSSASRASTSGPMMKFWLSITRVMAASTSVR